MGKGKRKRKGTKKEEEGAGAGEDGNTQLSRSPHAVTGSQDVGERQPGLPFRAPVLHRVISTKEAPPPSSHAATAKPDLAMAKRTFPDAAGANRASTWPHDARQEFRASAVNAVEQASTHPEDGVQLFAARPDFAQVKGGSEVLTNHFSVTFKSGARLWEYEIGNIPANATRPKKRVLVEAMISKRDLLQAQKKNFATDYQNKIISWVDLSQWDKELHGVARESNDRLAQVNIENFDARSSDGVSQQLSLTLDAVRVHDLGSLQSFCDGNKIAHKDNGLIQALNIVLARAADDTSKDIFRVGNQKFFVKGGSAPLKVDHKIAIRGYFSKIRPAMGGVLLNFNTAMSTFHEPVLVSHYIMGPQNHRVNMKRDLIRVRVWVNFERTNAGDDHSLDDPKRRTKTIVGFSDSLAGTQVAFERKIVWSHMSASKSLRSDMYSDH